MANQERITIHLSMEEKGLLGTIAKALGVSVEEAASLMLQEALDAAIDEATVGDARYEAR